MLLQNDFKTFVDDIYFSENPVPENDHNFVKNNTIYFHATSNSNANNIDSNGFLISKANPTTKFVYFGKSISTCISFLKDNVNGYTVFAVDLENFISDITNKHKFKIEDGIVTSAIDVDKKYIVGKLAFPLQNTG